MVARERHHAFAPQREFDGAFVHHHPGARLQVMQKRRLGQQAAGGVTGIGQHGRVERDAVARGGLGVGHHEARRAQYLDHLVAGIARCERVLHRARRGHAHGAGLVGLGDRPYHVADGGPAQERLDGHAVAPREHRAQGVGLAVGRVAELAGGEGLLDGGQERRRGSQRVRGAGKVDPVHFRTQFVGRGQQLLGKHGDRVAHAGARLGSKQSRHRCSFPCRQLRGTARTRKGGRRAPRVRVSSAVRVVVLSCLGSGKNNPSTSSRGSHVAW